MKRTIGLATVIALLLVVASCGDDSDGEVSTAGQSISADQAISDMLDRRGHATAWVEGSLFVYGGQALSQAPSGDAALIDLANGVVSPLPAAPVPASLHNPAAVTEGSEVFVIGEPCATTVEPGEESDPTPETTCEPGGVGAAVYSSSEQAWRTIDVPGEMEDAVARGALVGEIIGVTTDGRVVLEIYVEPFGAVDGSAFWTYSLSDDEWVHLDSPGVEGDDACLATDSLVVSSSQAQGDAAEVTGVALRVLDLSEAAPEWEVGPTLGRTLSIGPKVDCGDTFALSYSFEDTGWLVLRSNLGELVSASWLEQPSLPEDVFPEAGRWTGEELVLFGADGAAGVYNPIDEGWTRASVPPWPNGSRPVWTGDAFVGLSETATDGVDSTEIAG